MEQNRKVFAVAGPVDSLATCGRCRQTRDDARLIEAVDDNLAKLGQLADEPPSAIPPSSLSAIRNDRFWATLTIVPPASTS
jgi:predicted Rossmann fold nucleotide-binding protein DprA/Smf involved in DNA uptake